MGNIYKPSAATIRTDNANSRFVYLLESENPEKSLSRYLRDFLQTVGYSELFPNFDNIRVSTVHPFVILLSQEVLGTSQKVNVFPSITVVDSTMAEDVEVLGDELIQAVWTAEDMAQMDGLRQQKLVYVSDSGWTRLQERLAEKNELIGITRQYHTSHSIDFNIWSENKDITNFLFDMVCHFITQKRNDIHENLGYDLSNIQGRRSGDINLDFGKLLYGANVTISMAFNHRATLFDTAAVSISEVDTQSLPAYFVLNTITYSPPKD